MVDNKRELNMQGEVIFENTECPTKRCEQHGQARWYERASWPYRVDIDRVKEWANWVRQVDWKLFCTFTFAWRVSDLQADKTFAAFINRLERALKCDVAYVRGDEKRPSGRGRPECGRHYHALLTSAAPLNSTYVAWLWMSMAGNRGDNAGAKVEPYNPARTGAEYVLKGMNEVDGDWKFRKLELFHPESRGQQKMTKRFRRSLRRHKVRLKKFANTQVPQTHTKIATNCTPQVSSKSGSH
jgi:hypothetical protein